MPLKTKPPTTCGAIELTEEEMDKVSAGAGDAVFDNFVGFYRITDTNGGIDRDAAGRTGTRFADAAYRLGHE